MSRWLGHALAVATFGFLAYWSLGYSLGTPATIAMPGDGIGTIGWIFDMNEHARSHGLSSIFTGAYHSSTIGGGMNLFGLPSSWFQRLLYFSLGSIVGDADVYDAIAMLCVFVIGLAGFIFGQVLGLGIFFSLLLGACMLGLPSLDIKLPGHLFLANYYAAIFVVAAAIYYLRNPGYRRLALLVIANWVNFMIAEYYGYFGALVSFAMVITGLLWTRPTGDWRHFFLKHFPLASFSFLALMTLSFPDMILGIASSVFQGSTAIVSNYTRLEMEYTLHAMHNSFSIFLPNAAWLSSLLSPWIGGPKNGSEFIYRIGFFIPIMLGLLIPLLGLWVKRKKQESSFIWIALVSLIGASVAYCLALRPEEPFSLVPFTREVAPMMKVSVRALLYVQILSLGMFVYCLSTGLKSLRWMLPKNSKAASAASGVLAITLLGLGYLDLAPVSIFHRSQAFALNELPFKPGYDALANEPEGYLLELPFQIPGLDSPEGDYDFYIGRMQHHKPILNGGIPFDGEIGAAAARLQILGRFNHAEAAFVASARQLGIQYVSIHRRVNFDPDLFQGLNGLELIYDSPNHKIFRVMGAGEFSVAKLRKWLWQGPHTIYAYTLASQEPKIEVFHRDEPMKSYRLIHKQEPGLSWLSYGPYIPLSPGQYRVTTRVGFKGFQAYKDDDEILFVDIVAEHGGERQRRSISYSQLRDESLELSLDFSIERTGKVQVRMRAAHPGEYFQDRLLIESLKSDLSLPLAFRRH